MRKLLLLFVAFPVMAQQLGETIEVRVANIDVVVTDRAGNPIQGLTKDDFQLFENRKPQPLTNFYEVRAETAQAEQAGLPVRHEAEVRPRSIAVFIDDRSIDPIRRGQVVDSIVKTLDTLLRPGDDAMIVGFDNRLHVVQPFTTDRDQLKRVLERLRPVAYAGVTIASQREEVMSRAAALLRAASARRGMSMDDAYAQAIGFARNYAERMRRVEKQVLDSVVQTISMLSGGEAKKVLLFVGGDLDQKPGLDVFQRVDALFALASRNAIPAVIREGELNIGDDLVKVARNANANGVTMYMIDPLDRAQESISSAVQELPSPQIDYTLQSNTYQSIALLASETGGGVLSGSRNFSFLLDRISRDLGSYYSLGYKPAEGGGTDRDIRVRVNRPGAVVRVRRSYAIKSSDEQLEDRVIANAFHTTLKSDFPITLEVGTPEPFEKGLFKVKATISFPADLTNLHEGDDLIGGYAVYFVTASADGNLSPVGHQLQPLKFPASAAAELKQRTFTHTTTLVVRPGTQSISVAFVDRAGARTAYARASFTAH